jgi:enamine deaminase RidA (YjgF/YER057c/UK114 family)
LDEDLRVFSGSPYEARFGFCRALRSGDRVLVAGTAPVWPDGSCDPDPARQARRCCEIILAAMSELGAEARQVVRTRMYITDAADAEAIGRAHGDMLGGSSPVSTMVVVAGLVDARWKVEIEVEARLD